MWEGGYVEKHWDKWDSDSCSQYKSVQILIITVYHKGWGGKRLFIPCCFSLPNCHQLPYTSALGARPLHPLLPPPSSDFTMGCHFPGTSLRLCPTTGTLVWLHKQVLHIFAIRAPPGLPQAHEPPRLLSGLRCIHCTVRRSPVAGYCAGLKNVLCWVVCENLNCNEEVVPSAYCADQCCLICSLMWSSLSIFCTASA